MVRVECIVENTVFVVNDDVYVENMIVVCVGLFVVLSRTRRSCMLTRGRRPTGRAKPSPWGSNGESCWAISLTPRPQGRLGPVFAGDGASRHTQRCSLARW